MRLSLCLMLLILLGWRETASAETVPSFRFPDAAQRATDIVLATEGDKIDGKLKVLEVWKGSGLKPDETISIPELAAFAPQERRLVYHARGYLVKDTGPPKYVTGSRMVLFLVQPAAGSQKWQPAIEGIPGHEMDASVVWIEGDELFACIQIGTKGRGADVVPLALEGKQFTGPAFKGLVKEVVDAQAKLLKAKGP